MLSSINGAYMGKGFLPGLKKAVRGVTTTVAKAFLPSSLVDAAASFDPTRKKALDNSKKSATELIKPTPKPKAIVKPRAKQIPIVPLAIGGVAILALIIIGKKGR